MVKIPVKFKRVAAAFDEVARGRLCESSGSEHSAESFTDLSDLVNSFLERDIKEDGCGEEVDDQEKVGNEDEGESKCSETETKDRLKSLLSIGDDDVKRKIHAEVEKACFEDGSFSSPGGKRRLMTRLRDRGLDAGLCKSKWEKQGRCPSGVYQYIDVIVDGSRYIVEVSLAGEFEIARPTGCYTSLIGDFPPIFVGKVEELKKIVRLMCNAIRTSMKRMNISVPPWRRPAYMHSKWFGSYKRTINEVSSRKAIDPNVDLAAKRSVGFVTVPAISYYCREDFSSKVGVKVGNLTAALSGSSMLL